MATESGFDFASLVAKETETMTLMDLTGKEIPGVSFELYSKDSDRYLKEENRITQKRLRKARGTRGGTVPLDAAEIRSDDIELLARCVGGWKGVTYKGKVLEYSHQNAVMLLNEVPYIKEQIDAFVGDRQNFLPR